MSPNTISSTTSSKSQQKKRERSNDLTTNTSIPTPTTTTSSPEVMMMKQQRLRSSSSAAPANNGHGDDGHGDDAQNRCVTPDVVAVVANSSLVGKDGGLCSLSSVDRLLNIMHHEKVQKSIVDLTTNRTMLARVVSSTIHHDFLSKFLRLGGLSFLDQWLNEALQTYLIPHPHNPHPSSSDPSQCSSVGKSEAEKQQYSCEELFVTIIGALERLPIDLIYLKSCSIGKTMKSLRSHRNPEIQRRAKKLVDMWKKRVDAEIKQTSHESSSSIHGNNHTNLSGDRDHVIHSGDDAEAMKRHKSNSLITDLAEDSIITSGGKFASVASLCASPERTERRLLKISSSSASSSPLSSLHAQSRGSSSKPNTNKVVHGSHGHAHELPNDDGISMLAKIAAGESSSISDLKVGRVEPRTDHEMVMKKASEPDSVQIHSKNYHESENASECNLQPSVQAAVSGITVERSEHLDRISSSVSSPSETNSKLDVIMCESRDHSVDTTNSEIISLDPSAISVKTSLYSSAKDLQRNNEEEILQGSMSEEEKRVEAVGDSSVTDMVEGSKVLGKVTKACVNDVQGSVITEVTMEGHAKDSCEQECSRISARTSHGSLIRHNPSVESLREKSTSYDDYDDDDGVKATTSLVNSSSSLPQKHGGTNVIVNERVPVFDLNERVSNCEVEAYKAPTILNTPDLSTSGHGVIAMPIAVMADTKGSFTLPVLSFSPIAELGWKGSAATSAFRPTQPRRPSDKAVINSSTSTSTSTAKQVLEFDLNISVDSEEHECNNITNAIIRMVQDSTCKSLSDVHERTKLIWDLNQADEGGPSSYSSTDHKDEVSTQKTGAKSIGFDLNVVDTEEPEPQPSTMTPRNQNSLNVPVSHLNGLQSIPSHRSMPTSAPPPSSVAFVSPPHMSYPLVPSSTHPWPATGCQQDAMFPYTVCMGNSDAFQSSSTYPVSHLTSAIASSSSYGGFFPLATSNQVGFSNHVPSYMEIHQVQPSVSMQTTIPSSSELSNCMMSMMIPPHHKNHPYMMAMDMPTRDSGRDVMRQKQQHQLHHQQYQEQLQHQHHHQVHQHHQKQQSGQCDEGFWGKEVGLDLNVGPGPDQSNEERRFMSGSSSGGVAVNEATLKMRHHHHHHHQQQQQQSKGGWSSMMMQQEQERMNVKQVIWKQQHH